jgi:hypothetical protein
MSKALMWEFDDSPKLIYPGDHKVGMKVPKGGSSCAKCRYVTEDMKECTQKDFVAWNHGPELPEKADEYCCDMFEAK